MAKTIRETLAENVAELIPSNGDKAYTRYDGREFVGILYGLTRPEERIFGTMDGMDNRSIGQLMPEDPNEDWGYHRDQRVSDYDNTPMRGLGVGYDEEIKWDPARDMFYAPADSD